MGKKGKSWLCAPEKLHSVQSCMPAHSLMYVFAGGIYTEVGKVYEGSISIQLKMSLDSIHGF